MEESNQKTQQEIIHSEKRGYDKYYKVFLFIPIIIVLVSLVFIYKFYQNTGDIIVRDISLSGGTAITLIHIENPEVIEEKIKAEIQDVSFRKLTDIKTGESLALIIESSLAPEELRLLVEKAIGEELTEENSSIEFSGPTLSKNFYKQLIWALVLSFISMSIVVFIFFRTLIPSFAIIFAVFADMVLPLLFVQYFKIRLSAAGIAAFLMIIGYGVDTNILLTTKAIKEKEGTINNRIFQAFKTGSFMTSTALLAVLPAFFLITSLPDSFKQIFLILAIGLFADLLNTWMTNAGIIKWYCTKKGIK